MFYGWIIAGAGFVISFMGIGTRYCFGVFLKSIETEFTISRGAASGFFSVYMLLCCLLAILGGLAMDKHGPRKVGIFMAIFTGFSLLLTSQVNASWQLWITYSLMLSLGTGPTYGVVNSTASRWFEKKRGFVVGITSSGGGVGAFVLAPLATYLISNYSWRSSFAVLGLVAFIGMVTAALLFRKDPRDMGLLPDGAKSDPLPDVPRRQVNEIRTTDLSIAKAFKMSQFWLLGFTWVFMSLSLHMIFVHVVPYAVDKGHSPMDAAFILSLIGLANIPGRLVIGGLSDNMGRKSLGTVCAFIQFGTVLWLMGATPLWMFYVFGVAYGFLWGGAVIIVTALIADLFGTRSLGAIMGAMSGGWALGAAIGPAIGGYIFDASGDYFAALGAGAAALFSAAWLIALIKHPINLDERVHTKQSSRQR
jgi:MFS family permease